MLNVSNVDEAIGTSGLAHLGQPLDLGLEAGVLGFKSAQHDKVRAGVVVVAHGLSLVSSTALFQALTDLITSDCNSPLGIIVEPSEAMASRYPAIAAPLQVSLNTSPRSRVISASQFATAWSAMCKGIILLWLMSLIGR